VVITISNDNQLGASSGAVTIGGGTLRAAANITTARAINVGAGTIEVPAGSVLTESGAFTVAGGGSFRKTGGGTLTVNGTWNVGTNSASSILAGTVVIHPSSGSVNLSADNVGNNYIGDVIIDLSGNGGSSNRINL